MDRDPAPPCTAIMGRVRTTARPIKKSTNARTRFGNHVASMQDVQKVRQQGRSRRKTGSVASGYVEDFREARTQLGGFFNILS
jgi:hypothetical protein